MPDDEKNIYRKIFKIATIVITLVVIYSTALEMVDLIQSEEPISFLSLFRVLGQLFALTIFYFVWYNLPKETDAKQDDKPHNDSKGKEDAAK